MQFTYEREGNLCWIADYLTFTKKDNVVHYKEYTGTYEGVETSSTKVNNLLNYLDEQGLTVDNFLGLENYLKENYPELLPKSELTEKELIIELVNIVELFATENPDWVN